MSKKHIDKLGFCDWVELIEGAPLHKVLEKQERELKEYRESRNTPPMWFEGIGTPLLAEQESAFSGERKINA